MAKRTTTKRSRGKTAKKASAGSRRRPAARAALPDIAPASKLSVKNLNTANALPTSVGGTGMANTVVYIHGIANKPPASVLKCQWDTALFGTRLGDRTRMAYWVNRERYPAPSDETCGSPDAMSTKGIASISGIPSAMAAGDGTTIEASIKNLTSDPARQAFLEAIALKMQAVAAQPTGGVSVQDVHAKIFPLPEWARRLVADQLTKAFLADVHDFLFDATRRDAMEQALIDRLEPGGGPFVVVAHSQGTMIAYDVLRRMDAAKIKVPLFVTVGSPLGMQEVQDGLRKWIGKPTGKLPFPKCVDRWVNVAERFDPVAADPTLADEYEGKIEDINGFGLNPNWFGDPHSSSGYLSTEHVRGPVREAVGTAFPQAIAPFAIAKDLVAQIEDGHREQRHEVLIQLADTGSGKGVAKNQTKQIADGVVGKIHDIVTSYGCTLHDAKTETLRHFVSAQLTRMEVESLRSSYKDLKIAGIWRNASKRALISESTHTVQARPANLGYGADGRNIVWAVLDTGIRADHPHFKEYKNVVEQWDCTQPGPLTQPVSAAKSATLDGNGHGTHVAGTIAGGVFQIPDAKGIPVDMTGMAPRCLLYGFKVLADSGSGQDSWIIKALDKITEINEAAGQLVIHGVNLSLGGGFDPSAFGCGHTPLCQELRRLCRQGVLVCLAAGNEGYALLAGDGGEIQANLDLSIGDPANLEEAIAVGSVHKTNPHTYGISYFSSRGPTADGRRKPDVVAPGEKIVSAAHDWKTKAKGTQVTVGTHYVEMSGTSMATPHVSGVLAAYLSLRREFIGYPERVKQMLLDGCVDLSRDPYAQGAGLPNLIKMLALN